ncbi:sensor histidine kinase [Sanguibacter antarcticus]|uniref:Anti-sigma regulatory factor (Ser/Thr protein kinase) n=1 Tax=Sanguibacter antarcticus TaxID=372484 RepID=A0A2A9E852_9MICO|nr:sensor histidine kinase [Sanguibacter antarcticus]PFG35237.1 anti-sigma regulatory factor (Ser/Thr protein kinase) [Sanguibacter antarcticus]
MTHPSPSTASRSTYHHEAFLWSGLDAFLARTVPFVLDATRSGFPVLVAVTASRETALRDALGTDAEAATFRTMNALGHNPARIIPAWVGFVAANRDVDVPLRGIGEPIWAGRRDTELTECQIHEAMLNVAIPSTAPLWLLCPYDVDSLPENVLDEARHSHPTLDDDLGGTTTNPDYRGSAHARALSRGDLPEPGARPDEMHVGRGDLGAVRALVSRHGHSAGLSPNQVDDLRLALTEVAANSLDHGGGHGLMRAWHEPGALVFEVRDGGTMTNLLAGRTVPRRDQARGRGLWLVNQLCDLMQIRSTDSGTVVRVYTWL